MLINRKDARLVDGGRGSASAGGALGKPGVGGVLQVGAAPALVLRRGGASDGGVNGFVAGVGVVANVAEAALGTGAHVPEAFVFSDRDASCEGVGYEDGEGYQEVA